MVIIRERWIIRFVSSSASLIYIETRATRMHATCAHEIFYRSRYNLAIFPTSSSPCLLRLRVLFRLFAPFINFSVAASKKKDRGNAR